MKFYKTYFFLEKTSSMYEVRSFSSVDNLRYLRDFFLSSLGSKGAYKILVTSAGQVI